MNEEEKYKKTLILIDSKLTEILDEHKEIDPEYLCGTLISTAVCALIHAHPNTEIAINYIKSATNHGFKMANEMKKNNQEPS